MTNPCWQGRLAEPSAATASGFGETNFVGGCRCGRCPRVSARPIELL